MKILREIWKVLLSIVTLIQIAGVVIAVMSALMAGINWAKPFLVDKYGDTWADIAVTLAIIGPVIWVIKWANSGNVDEPEEKGNADDNTLSDES